MTLACNAGCVNCSFGIAPSDLTILPVKRVNASKQPAATILDNVPILNVKPFGMCMTPSNPAVASIIASSLGTVTQAPCIPAIVAPWVAGKPNVSIGGTPALNNQSTAFCIWGGIISFIYPGQVTVQT
ncbi:DUF4280 domain-containing protein [Candidatus Cytomitobacter primus]|uniref:DUF4280 domain-containing protein n=1 Tax=Candidatus Cytomitobacter primus TaxID=2066024 RepID=A0A5C0UFC4_9PROT|nr:DUF4280 domain-containing protein [Candidatus Cytomitobacter primus]QEK38758.1 DUF4280 domain-containing protein [Candidatus Cytomitobacter primus]